MTSLYLVCWETWKPFGNVTYACFHSQLLVSTHPTKTLESAMAQEYHTYTYFAARYLRLDHVKRYSTALTWICCMLYALSISFRQILNNPFECFIWYTSHQNAGENSNIHLLYNMRAKPSARTIIPSFTYITHRVYKTIAKTPSCTLHPNHSSSSKKWIPLFIVFW